MKTGASLKYFVNYCRIKEGGYVINLDDKNRKVTLCFSLFIYRNAVSLSYNICFQEKLC